MWTDDFTQNALKNPVAPMRTSITNVTIATPPKNEGKALVDTSAEEDEKPWMKLATENATETTADHTHLVEEVLSRSQVLPLRHENERLVRSNNGLHINCVRLTEQLEEKERIYSSKFRKLATAHSDLKFLYNQKNRKIQDLENTVVKLQDKIDELLETKQSSKNMLDISARVSPSTQSITPQVNNAGLPPHMARGANGGLGEGMGVDVFKAAQARIEVLTKELSHMTEQREQWKQIEASYKIKFGVLETELERVSTALETERNWDRVQTGHELYENQKLIRKLSAQLDIATKDRAKAEFEAKDMKAKFKKLSATVAADPKDKRRTTTAARMSASQQQQQDMGQSSRMGGDRRGSTSSSKGGSGNTSGSTTPLQTPLGGRPETVNMMKDIRLGLDVVEEDQFIDVPVPMSSSSLASGVSDDEAVALKQRIAELETDLKEHKVRICIYCRYYIWPLSMSIYLCLYLYIYIYISMFTCV